MGQTATVPERATRSDRQPRRALPLTRRYEVAFLTPQDTVEEFSRVAPALPAFEEAFSAFGRGALVSTPEGFVAVEDLVPGMQVETADNGLQTLLWVGSITMVPPAGDIDGVEAPRLTRISTEAFGPDRPLPDLILGPYARLLYKNVRCMDVLGTASAFVPAEAFRDGLSVIAVSPIAPVRVYHLGFAGQQTLRANGLDVESYHPGPQFGARMDRTTLQLFLSLFPHASGREGFGPMKIPRMTSYEFETLGEL
ncbi:Hint domain-containing protein [Tropicimonas isoalkanivorans]|uniref:Hint domain-containing protein n=1 Tax=Tropicimonas isoalkanivorans TaxID=441112 RepID=UPI000B83BEA8|nr:Hint domain-containing protein [Tropicimonas isoalkanivorans]